MNRASWEEEYQNLEGCCPWDYCDADLDFVGEIRKAGRRVPTILDVGCGAGFQSIVYSRQGWRTFACDLALNACRKLQARIDAEGAAVLVFASDAVHLAVKSHFDFVTDRGCLHVLPPERRREYLSEVERALGRNGRFLLKCFHESEIRPPGVTPLAIKKEALMSLSSAKLRLVRLVESAFQVTSLPAGKSFPKAWFCIFEKVA